MFIEDHCVFRGRFARFQFGARPYAFDRERSECRQSAADLRGCIRWNNGVYGLTKGQFSATADKGSKAKKGAINADAAIDTVSLALLMGATFVARSFSGDKAQLVPLIQAGLRHNGFALIDVLSPCVTFNDHEGSTKSYTFTREHYHPAVEADFVPRAQEIAVDYAEGESIPVSLHDGSRVILRKLDPTYHPTDRSAAYNYIETKLKHNEYVTGLIHIDETDSTEFHNLNRTAQAPLNSIPFEKLSPGRAALDKLMGRYR